MSVALFQVTLCICLLTLLLMSVIVMAHGTDRTMWSAPTSATWQSLMW